jgi:hypothetical protein
MMYLLIITCVGCGDISATLVPYKIATYTDAKSCEDAGSLYMKSIILKANQGPVGPKAICIPVPSRADVINSSPY